MKSPLCIKVPFWTLKNRWFKSEEPLKRIGTDIVIAVLLYLLLKTTYSGVAQTLSELESRDILKVPPSHFMHLIMLCFMGLISFSAGVITLSAFFLSEEIPLFFAAPVSKSAFFLRKFFQVYTGASWLVFLMSLPILIAFQVHFESDWTFYLVGLPALFLTALIPVSWMISACLCITRICPAHRLKEAFVVLGLLIVSSAYYLLNTESTRSVKSIESIQHLQVIIDGHSPSNSYYYPVRWLANILGEMLVPQNTILFHEIGALFLCALFSLALSFFIFSKCYMTAYLKAQQQKKHFHKHGVYRKKFSTLRKLLPSHYIAVFSKEMKLFSRDLTQALQLVLILGLCFVYLYNFRNLHNTHIVSENVESWWQGFLILSNIFLGALITIAVAARFVYPTLSLEGKGFWILKSSPIPLQDILKIKFWFWFLPVSAISTVIFTSGALAIQASPTVVQLHALCSWVLCYGIVGMAIGLGALFSDFQWQHSAEITASMGNFLFMLASTCLVIILMFPIALLIILYTFKSSHMPLPTSSWYISVGGCAFLTCYVSYIARKIAFHIGTNALKKKM